MKDDQWAIQISTEEHEALEEAIRFGKIRSVSEAEWSRFVLRSLMNYHERITLNDDYPSLDCWKRGLQFAISCVEEKIPK